MAKRRKQPRSLPKRLFGVRVPKALRRAADTQLGSAILAQIIIAGGRAGLQSETAKRLQETAATMMSNVASSVTQAAQAATRPRPPSDELETAPPSRRGRRIPDTEADDRPH